jgi:SAM-dependent methyltransferase
MTVSREKDQVPPDPADVPTPPPVVRDLAAPEPVAGGESGRARSGAVAVVGGRRPLSQSPRERSGPIAISGGDFATPLVRRRTTTQPRGLPVVGPAVASEPPADPPKDAAPVPPPPNGTPPPVPVAVQGAEPEGPFGGGGAGLTPDIDDQAAVLAAEAAAVRALDSGPITPPPEVDPGPTPPPLSQRVTNGAMPAVAPQLADGPAASARAAPTPPPESELESAAAPLSAPEAVAQPPASDAQHADGSNDAGAIPTDALGAEVGNAAARPIAVEAASSSSEAEDEVASDDDLEVMDGADGALESLPAEALTDSRPVVAPPVVSPPPLRPATPPAQPRTPPPIPVSSLKTPNPELPVLDGESRPGGPPALPVLPILPEALAQRPRRPKRSKPWFEEVFDEDYLRTLPFMSPEQTLREVDFIEQSLQLPVGAEVLDVGCGYGRHAIELVHRGLNVTGLDLSLPLLIRAADEAQRRSLSVNFVHADMREMAFEKQFDGAYCMLTSFGYFDEEANLKVAEGIARALKPGARLLLDVVNRDYVIADLPSRVWWEGKGCVVLEEVDFNFHTSRIVTHRSIVFEDGRQLEQEISIRAYSLHEMGRLLKQAGLRLVEVSGTLATRGQFFGTTSRSLLVLTERRSDDG